MQIGFWQFYWILRFKWLPTTTTMIIVMVMKISHLRVCSESNSIHSIFLIHAIRVSHFLFDSTISLRCPDIALWEKGAEWAICLNESVCDALSSAIISSRMNNRINTAWMAFCCSPECVASSNYKSTDFLTTFFPLASISCLIPTYLFSM